MLIGETPVSIVEKSGKEKQRCVGRRHKPVRTEHRQRGGEEYKFEIGD